MCPELPNQLLGDFHFFSGFASFISCINPKLTILYRFETPQPYPGQHSTRHDEIVLRSACFPDALIWFSFVCTHELTSKHSAILDFKFNYHFPHGFICTADVSLIWKDSTALITSYIHFWRVRLQLDMSLCCIMLL